MRKLYYKIKAWFLGKNVYDFTVLNDSDQIIIADNYEEAYDEFEMIALDPWWEHRNKKERQRVRKRYKQHKKRVITR